MDPTRWRTALLASRGSRRPRKLGKVSRKTKPRTRITTINSARLNPGLPFDVSVLPLSTLFSIASQGLQVEVLVLDPRGDIHVRPVPGLLRDFSFFQVPALAPVSGNGPGGRLLHQSLQTLFRGRVHSVIQLVELQ